jgi:hypothetical protein
LNLKIFISSNAFDNSSFFNEQATIGSTAVVTANSAAAFIPANLPEYFIVTSGQVLNFISTSTSTGYVCLTEMT